MITSVIRLAAIALAGTAYTASAAASEVKLPPSITMTAYDTGTSGFNITVAIGKMMKDKYGSDTRVLPAGNDVARLQPLRAGRASLSAMGVGVFFAQEGLFEFATKEWGPQPVQITMSSVDCNGLSLAVAGDVGAKTMADLKGKRIGFVVGSPALNQNALAMLAFGGVTAKDVKIVEFASNNAMWKGAINNDVDAVSARPSRVPPRSCRLRRAASSGRRCRMPTRPAGNACARSGPTSPSTTPPAAPVSFPRTSRSRWAPTPTRSIPYTRTSPKPTSMR